MPIQPIGPLYEVNGLDWQCYLAGSYKKDPRILIFSIAIGADYSYEVKNSEIWAPVFFKHNKTFTTTVWKEWLSVCHEIKTWLSLFLQSLVSKLKQRVLINFEVAFAFYATVFSPNNVLTIIYYVVISEYLLFS